MSITLIIQTEKLGPRDGVLNDSSWHWNWPGGGPVLGGESAA